MTYSACDLQTQVDEELADLGYHVIGDDDDGWGYAFGISESAPPMRNNFDTAAEASAAALTDLVSCVQDLLGASHEVLAQWEGTGLAQAVRELATAVKVLDPAASARTTERDRQEWLRARVRQLQLAGLTIDDCIEVLGVATAAHPAAREAALEHHVEGVIEFDAKTVVCPSQNGAYVLAWIWMPA